MAELYDKSPIYNVKLEAYIGYGKNDLSDMTHSELQDELTKTIDSIHDLETEINEADSFPSFVLKEKLLNLKDYKEKIENAMKEIYVKESFIEKNIDKLDELLKNGTITEEYHDKYVTKLLENKEIFLEDVRKNALKFTAKKHNKFKMFKESLFDYKK